jgi:hypothetical protein
MKVLTFEKEFGIKVNYDNYSSMDELRAKMEAGASGYDIIVPTDYMIPDFMRAGIVQPIDFENIPNFKNIGKKFKNPPYDPDGKFANVSRDFIGRARPTWRRASPAVSRPTASSRQSAISSSKCPISGGCEPDEKNRTDS